jgi:phosphate transport system protein
MERHHFEEELQALKNRLLTMGALVEERVHQAVRALIDRRQEEAERVIASDKEVNDLQIDVDDRCLKLLATQTPLAGDLRLITAAMKINADLERIGDQAVNIAENAVRMLAAPPLKPLIDLPRMAERAERMTRDSLDSFVKKDPNSATPLGDDEVDNLKDQVCELLTYMMANPHHPGPGPHPDQPERRRSTTPRTSRRQSSWSSQGRSAPPQEAEAK